MNTHYTKKDIIELASSIFINNINSKSITKSNIKIKSIAEAAFYASEIFFMKAATYHRNKLNLILSTYHNYNDELTNESSDQRKGERRQGERRGADKPLATDPRETSPEEEEAFARLEQALKDQFLQATLHASFNKAQ